MSTPQLMSLAPQVHTRPCPVIPPSEPSRKQMRVALAFRGGVRRLRVQNTLKLPGINLSTILYRGTCSHQMAVPFNPWLERAAHATEWLRETEHRSPLDPSCRSSRRQHGTMVSEARVDAGSRHRQASAFHILGGIISSVHLPCALTHWTPPVKILAGGRASLWTDVPRLGSTTESASTNTRHRSQPPSG